MTQDRRGPWGTGLAQSPCPPRSYVDTADCDETQQRNDSQFQKSHCEVGPFAATRRPGACPGSAIEDAG